MSNIHTSAYVGDFPEREGEKSVAVGRQRFIRHNYVPDAGPAMTWDHPETLARTCDACRENGESLGWDKYLELMADEAPLES